MKLDEVLSKIPPLFMVAMLTFWFFGFMNVNLYHHLTLPKEVLNRNTIETKTILTLRPPFFHKQSDVYMVDTINSYKQIEDVIIVLNDASSGDKINIHLAGFGGGVEQVERILNAMTSSKALVTTIVEAPVYSGHAFIALYGTVEVFKPFSYVMLHTSSGYDEDCSTQKGMDRGMTAAAEVCQVIKDAHMSLVNKVIWGMHNISVDTQMDIITGKSVVVGFPNDSKEHICQDGTCKVVE